jgi:hypothetical protein
LLWGDGDADERRKAVCKILYYGYLLLLLIYISWFPFLIGLLKLNSTEQLWIFLAFFAYAIKFH